MGAPLGRLLARSDFLRVAASGRRHTATGLLLQAADGLADRRRVGFTASRKVGNAVVRNRARRRLRAAAEQVIGKNGAIAHDYVLIARQATAERPYALLLGDLGAALRRLKLWRDNDAAS